MYLFRILPEQKTATLALGQGTQGGEIPAVKQNGTSDQGGRVIFGPICQPEDHPFCFFLCLEVLCKGAEQ